MRKLIFISHANVVIEPATVITEWHLSDEGVRRHDHTVLKDVKRVYCSDEQKALDGAKILAEHLNINARQIVELAEINRSTTGYLPPNEFREVVKAFFDNPSQSIRGWESAMDAQRRIVLAIETIIKSDNTDGDIAVVSHGGVGALLLCGLQSQPIDKQFDQPGDVGGNYFVIDMETLSVEHGWQPIA